MTMPTGREVPPPPQEDPDDDSPPLRAPGDRSEGDIREPGQDPDMQVGRNPPDKHDPPEREDPRPEADVSLNEDGAQGVHDRKASKGDEFGRENNRSAEGNDPSLTSGPTRERRI